MAYYALDPWGDQRADLRMAQLLSLYHNAHIAKKGQALAPAAFMPFRDEPPPAPQTQEQQMTVVQRMQKAIEARSKSRGERR